MRRTFLGILVATSALLAIFAVHPAASGTQAAPEITDPADDQQVCPNGTGAASTMGNAAANGDILSGWVTETATEIHFMVTSSGDFTTGSLGGYTYSFHATSGTTAVVASAMSTAGAPTAGGAATSVKVANGALDMTVPKTAFSNASSGSKLTSLFVEATGTLDPAGVIIFCDRAPDGTAFGTDYTVTGAPAGGNGTQYPNGAPGCSYRSDEANKTDNDADCLPDHWEGQYFGNTTAQNATGDPDHDGCNNGCEYGNGTDPTNAASKPTSTTTSTSTGTSTGTNTSTKTGTATGTGTTSKTTTSTGADTSSSTSQSPLDKIQAESGYTVASGSAMVAVVLVSLIGLFGRWGL
jgi:hypothetical protein